MALKNEEVFWEWNLMEGKNPTHTGNFLNSYDNRGFSSEEVIARESGQNAIDAGQGIKRPTLLVFQELVAEGKNKDRILDLLGMRDDLARRSDVFSKDERNKRFSDSLKKFLSEERIRALLIRDYETCGLGGAWEKHGKDDHFGRLVLALNLDDKAGGDENLGGSFGLGKTAYARSSTINTVIYHSVFKETESTAGVHRRLMGAGVYPRHEFEDKEWGGYAYIGQRQSFISRDAVPFENEKAERLWNSLGDAFGVDLSRSEKNHGTDVLILMDDIDWKSLKEAIEDYYFPALEDNRLHVQFIDRNKNIDVPCALEREDIKQFLDLYKRAGDGSAQKKQEESLLVGNLSPYKNFQRGSFAFQSITSKKDDEGTVSDEDDSKARKKINCVAIMRGTGMVIDYVKIGSDRYEPAIGVFVAHEDIKSHLYVAENAAHSEWNKNSPRLAEQFPENGKELVGRTNSAIKRAFEKFQKSLQPDVSQTRSEGGLLSRLLANAFSGVKGNKSPIKTNPNPVSLHLIQRERTEKKSIWRLTINECEHTSDSEFGLTLKPSVAVAGDSKKIPLQHRDFIVRDQVTRDIIPHEKGIDRGFSKGKTLCFDIEIDNPGHKNYLVQCKCSVNPTYRDWEVDNV